MTTPDVNAPRLSPDAIRSHAGFIWSIADLLRGDYKRSEYGRVILPLVVIRRLDCVLEPTRAAVLARARRLEGRIENMDPSLMAAAGQSFYNISPLDFRRLLDDPANIADNLRAYCDAFSPTARDAIDKFEFRAHITRLDRANLLFQVIARFAGIDLHPEAVSNLDMGYIYEELIRKFADDSNQFEETWAADEALADQARSNTLDNFRLVFEPRFMDTVVSRMDGNEAIFKQIMDDPDFQEVLRDFFVRKVYHRLRVAPGG